LPRAFAVPFILRTNQRAFPLRRSRPFALLTATYLSMAHRITVASDVRWSRAIAATSARCPLANVIVRRFDFLERPFLSGFITDHRSGECVTTMMTARANVNGLVPNSKDLYRSGYVYVHDYRNGTGPPATSTRPAAWSAAEIARSASSREYMANLRRRSKLEWTDSKSLKTQLICGKDVGSANQALYFPSCLFTASRSRLVSFLLHPPAKLQCVAHLWETVRFIAGAAQGNRSTAKHSHEEASWRARVSASLSGMLARWPWRETRIYCRIYSGC
jgi:hypothetical protein